MVSLERGRHCFGQIQRRDKKKQPLDLTDRWIERKKRRGGGAGEKGC